MGNSNHCNNDFLYSSVHRRLLPVGIVSHSARLPRPEVRSAPCILYEGPGAARARRRNFGGNHLDRLGPSPRHPRRARLQVTTTAMKIGLFFAKKWAIIGIFFFILVFSVQFFKSPMTRFEARTYSTRKESIMIWCWKSSFSRPRKSNYFESRSRKESIPRKNTLWLFSALWLAQHFGSEYLKISVA